MSDKPHFQMMASYNQWMNHKVYQSASRLSTEDLSADRNAFFKSVLGTLNHIVVADTIWLKRFVKHLPQMGCLNSVNTWLNPSGLDAILFDNFNELTKQRQEIDQVIIDFTHELNDQALSLPFDYLNTKGQAFKKTFSLVLLHFFNHQTHHRGQVTTLLSQQGIDVGATDILLLVPDL